MPQTPLTKDLIDSPGLWRLSLLVSDAGIDVLAHRVVGESSIVVAHFDFDSAAGSVAAALEDVVYANPMLLLPFGKIDIVVATSRFFIVPPEVASDSESVEALSDIFKEPEGQYVRYVSDIDSRNSLIYMLDKGVSNFLGRTFDRCTPVHVLAVLGRYFSHKSQLGNSSKIFVNLSKDTMDILVYDNLGLAAANTFTCTDINDAAYYILAVGRTAGLDPQSSETMLAGDSDRRSELAPLLRRFLSYVMPAIFPSAAYRGNPLVLKAPFPLSVLPLCE